MGIIRVLLAISVVIAHSMPVFGNTMVGGTLAVQAFYIISGFYMALILNEKYNNYKLFITNRLLRLLPTYWFVLILAIGYSIFIFAVNREHAAYLDPYFDHFSEFSLLSKLFIVLANLFVIGQDIIMYLGIDLQSGNLFYTGVFNGSEPPLYSFLFMPQAWTISLELMFYLIAPFIVRRKTTTILLFISLSLLLRFILVNKGLNYDPWTYRFFPNELSIFLMGAISYKMYKRKFIAQINSYWRLLIWISFLIITMLYQFIPWAGKPIIYLLITMFSIPFIFHHFKNNKLDTYIGEISYPIYLSHLLIMVVMSFISNFFGFSLGSEWSLSIIFITIFFSLATIQFIIKPIDKYRQNRIRALNK
ncbi:MAG: acyltransferase [Marinilabiliaceae bacterium]|nr:acyltransferase [Marinilabiliaceae bacterium]